MAVGLLDAPRVPFATRWASAMPGLRPYLDEKAVRDLRRARAWRAGGEARIAPLKHTFGVHRTRYRGESGVARSAHWAGIANNLMAIGRHEP